MTDDPTNPISPSSSKTSSKDSTFEPTVDMMVNDFDDEQTLEEEEALAAQEQEDQSAELSNLQKESEMPIEELLALYNCAPPEGTPQLRGGRSGATRKRKKPALPNEAKEEVDKNDTKKERILNVEEIIVEKDETGKKELQNNEEIFEETLMTNTSSKTPEHVQEKVNLNDMEGNEDQTTVADEEESDDDDEDDESKEISHLRKLYPETYRSGDKRLLRTLSRQQSDEEEDNDYSPDEDDIKKTIMVGSEFQAVIPEGFSKYDDVLPYENEDKLLWDPSRLSEEQTIEYLTKAKEQSKSSNSSSNPNSIIESLPCGKHLRDDEQSLFLLLQCGHNIEEALRRKRINPVPSTDQMSIWSEEECRNFESVIRLYGKDFHTIKHAKVHTRSVGELVQFYYLWKKTERHDVFANKARLEKKKYNLHPGLTDYMDRFLEELDTTSNNPSCNSSSIPLDRSLSPSTLAAGASTSTNNPTAEINATLPVETSNQFHQVPGQG